MPIIAPLLFYQGPTSPYPASTDIVDCFEKPELAREILLKPFKLQEDRLEEKSAFIRNLYAIGMDNAFIGKSTGLSSQEIEKILKQTH